MNEGSAGRGWSIAARLTSFGPRSVRVGPEGIEAWYRVGAKAEVALDPL